MQLSGLTTDYRSVCSICMTCCKQGLYERENVQLMAFDVDGVFTDGTLYYGIEGDA